MLLNEKLKKLRKDKNLTQEDLAEKLNVLRQDHSKYIDLVKQEIA
ncbi:MAG: helix-turn-helix transcriptional regulator [Clostridia bacterium]|nr:helix-turn-helix transcriptional regulator [Clostridia bacterium]